MRMVLLCLCLIPTLPVGAEEPRDTTAAVAAWNIRGKPDPLDGTRAKQIARGVLLLDAELVALIEVNPMSIVTQIVAELAELGATYKAITPPQVSELQLAMLFKPGVEVSNARLLDEVNLGDPNKRKALTADVRIGRFDFHLVSVHLKSGGYPAEQAIRAQQIGILAQHFKQVTAGSEKDLLLVGDYNMTPTRDADYFPQLGSDGLLRFVSNEDLSRLGSHLIDGRYGNLLDGFAISREHSRREYVDGSLRIFPMNRALHYSLADYQRLVSDHLPLIARFQTTRDDD